MSKIKYLCSKISQVEWSGVLFYSLKGNIKNASKMICVIEDILPMDMGSAAYTEYSFDDRVVTFLQEEEERFDWHIGHIHSHNNMKTFFSATDMSELNDNSENHNFYLSLIVNNAMDLTAKVAQKIQLKDISFLANDRDGNTYSKKLPNDKEILMIYDCNIIVPEGEILENSFIKSVDKIIKDNEEANKKTNIAPDLGWDFDKNTSLQFDFTDNTEIEKALIYCLRKGITFKDDTIEDCLDDIDQFTNWHEHDDIEYYLKRYCLKTTTLYNSYDHDHLLNQMIYKLDEFSILYPEIKNILKYFNYEPKI